jgi:hypothetical protein
VGKNQHKPGKIHSSTSISPNLVHTYKMADLFDRGLAYIIDLILLVLPIGLINISLYGSEPPPQESTMWSLIAYFGVFLAYFFLLTWLNHGQTLGQMLLRIRVVPSLVTTKSQNTSNNPEIQVHQAFIYALGKIIYILPFDLLIGYFIGLKSPNAQKPTRTFALWAECISIKEEKEEKPKPLEYHRPI